MSKRGTAGVEEREEEGGGESTRAPNVFLSSQPTHVGKIRSHKDPCCPKMAELEIDRGILRYRHQRFCSVIVNKTLDW